MNSTIQKQENGTITLTITVPATELKKTRDEIVEAYSKQTQVPGFRKGKAPKKLVENKIDPQSVEEELLKTLLPKAYSFAVKQHNLSPIVNPRVHIEKLEEGKDLTFVAETCESPKIDLGDYKAAIKNITAKSKIVIPGKQPQEVNFDQIMEELIKNTKVIVPALIIETETQRLLSQTLDEVKKLGMSLEQYLASTGKTAEQLRNDYSQKAENDIKIEFALGEVARQENITVEHKDVDEAIAKAKDENEKRSLQANSYLLASILRQQKTLDFLKSL